MQHDLIYRCVNQWMEARDNVTSAWRLQSTGFQVDSRSRKGINEFASAMNFRTKELISILRTDPTLTPELVGRWCKYRNTPWFGFRDQCATYALWTSLHSEALYELVMNFDQFVSILPE